MPTFFSVLLTLLCYFLVANRLMSQEHTPAFSPDAVASNSEATPPNRRIREVYELVYQIKTATDAQAPKASYGSSFVVGKDGILATNFHVVSSALFEPERYRLFLVDGEQSIEAKVLAFDVVNDLALIKVPKEFSKVVNLAQIPPHMGSKIYSIGLPEDLNKSIIEGNYNGIVAEGPYQKLQMSIPLNPGMSGGPTVDEAGKLIGINVSLRLESQNLAFSVPVQLLRNLLKKPSLNLVGSEARKIFDDETRRQLEEVQDNLTKMLTKSRQEPVRMLGWVSERPSQYIKCWRESEAGSQNLSLTNTESCYLPNGATLRPDVDLGSFRVRYQAISGEKLNSLQFVNKVNYHVRRYNLDTVDYIEGFTTKFHCEEIDLVNASAVPLRVHYCFSGYLRYSGLYNLELRAITLTRQKSLFQVQVSLSGFSANNALEIGQHIVDSIHPESGS